MENFYFETIRVEMNNFVINKHVCTRVWCCVSKELYLQLTNVDIKGWSLQKWNLKQSKKSLVLWHFSVLQEKKCDFFSRTK